jgi:hypothetical protein
MPSLGAVAEEIAITVATRAILGWRGSPGIISRPPIVVDPVTITFAISVRNFCPLSLFGLFEAIALYSKAPLQLLLFHFHPL